MQKKEQILHLKLWTVAFIQVFSIQFLRLNPLKAFEFCGLGSPGEASLLRTEVGTGDVTEYIHHFWRWTVTQQGHGQLKKGAETPWNFGRSTISPLECEADRTTAISGSRGWFHFGGQMIPMVLNNALHSLDDTGMEHGAPWWLSLVFGCTPSLHDLQNDSRF